MIKSRGREYTVRNASGGGGRDTPSYSDDGSLIGVVERRGMPRTVRDSSGADVESDLEIRAIPDGVTLREAGSASGYPTKLFAEPLYGDSYGELYAHGPAYRLLEKHTEDAGVTVLTVVRD